MTFCLITLCSFTSLLPCGALYSLTMLSLDPAPPPHNRRLLLTPMQILRLVNMEEHGASGARAMRATCTHWRSVIDANGWRTARGCLRNAHLGPLPPLLLRRPLPLQLELTFDSCHRNSVAELGEAEQRMFVAALRRLKLEGDAALLGGAAAVTTPEGALSSAKARPNRVLALHFGNYSVSASTVSLSSSPHSLPLL